MIIHAMMVSSRDLGAEPGKRYGHKVAVGHKLYLGSAWTHLGVAVSPAQQETFQSNSVCGGALLSRGEAEGTPRGLDGG